MKNEERYTIYNAWLFSKRICAYCSSGQEKKLNDLPYDDDRPRLVAAKRERDLSFFCSSLIIVSYILESANKTHSFRKFPARECDVVADKSAECSIVEVLTVVLCVICLLSIKSSAILVYRFSGVQQLIRYTPGLVSMYIICI